MSLPLTGAAAIALGPVSGFCFGWLLHRARVTDTNVIVNQFRLRDFTVAKVMLTAIIVGGVGVFVLHGGGLATYHIKDANLLGVILGAVLFGIGMVVYGYCPGTGVAAIGTGSVHALIGAIGMLAGGILYALSFDWLKTHVLSVWTLGKVRLPDQTGIPDLAWFAVLAIFAAVIFAAIEWREAQHHP